MKSWVQVKTHYEIKERIGGGLTSEVYRAYRADQEGFTKQEVALKILNSKKDIQIFKLEFEKMLNIYSKYCVRVLAWENINDKRALVLEYVSGQTLSEFLKSNDLSYDESLEVLSQVKQGLLDLHSQNISHGDLNLTNIMINQEGLIKLIDFGSEDPVSGGQLLTSDFASPERLSGNSATPEDDFFAYQRLMEILLGNSLELTKIPKSKAAVRRSLAKKIKKSQLKFKTQMLVQKMNARTNWFKKLLLSTACFLLCFLVGNFSMNSTERVDVRFQSNNWYSFSVNGLPKKYGPIESLKLRKGIYEIRIENQKGERSFAEKIATDRTFLLQPDH